MKKGLLMLLAVAAAFAVATQSIAGGSRLAGMAADARITEDQNLVFMYPNKALEYSNLVDIRLGVPGIGDEWGGFVMKQDDLGALGVYVNRPGAASANGFYGPFIQFFLAPQAVELFWAKEFSGLNLGVQLLYASSRDHSNDTTLSDMGVNVGLGFTSDALSQLNIHASFETASAQFGNFESSGNPMQLTAGVLAQKDVDSDHYLRFFGDVTYNTSPYFDENFFVFESSSRINWDLGLGCVKKVNGGKALISGGLIVAQSSDDGTVAGGGPEVNLGNSTSVNWSTSVEATVNSWLVVRTGITKPLYSSANKITNGDFNWAIGSSINWQNFTLDLNINPISVENLIDNPEVGGGIFYPSSNNVGLVAVASADLSYKF